MTDTPRRSDDEQAARWNGPAGHAWVDLQEVLDGMFRPFEELLVEAVAACSTSGAARAVSAGPSHGGPATASASTSPGR
jgi:hypothetical protein